MPIFMEQETPEKVDSSFSRERSLSAKIQKRIERRQEKLTEVESKSWEEIEQYTQAKKDLSFLLSRETLIVNDQDIFCNFKRRTLSLDDPKLTESKIRSLIRFRNKRLCLGLNSGLSDDIEQALNSFLQKREDRNKSQQSLRRVTRDLTRLHKWAQFLPHRVELMQQLTDLKTDEDKASLPVYKVYLQEKRSKLQALLPEEIVTSGSRKTDRLTEQLIDLVSNKDQKSKVELIHQEESVKVRWPLISRLREGLAGWNLTRNIGPLKWKPLAAFSMGVLSIGLLGHLLRGDTPIVEIELKNAPICYESLHTPSTIPDLSLPLTAIDNPKLTTEKKNSTQEKTIITSLRLLNQSEDYPHKGNLGVVNESGSNEDDKTIIKSHTAMISTIKEVVTVSLSAAEKTNQQINKASEFQNTLIDSTPVEYHKHIHQAARKYGLPPRLLSAMLYEESRFKPYAISSVGAIGIAQFTKDTAKDWDVNPYDEESSIYGAARYLKYLYTKYQSWPLALAAYNSGPGNVDEYNDIPPFPETKRYVTKVLSWMSPHLSRINS